MVSPHDVIAEFSFEIPKSPDELLREQVEAASGVPPVYVQSPAAADSVIARRALPLHVAGHHRPHHGA